jgi:hypothetical protein
MSMPVYNPGVSGGAPVIPHHRPDCAQEEGSGVNETAIPEIEELELMRM